MLKKMFLFFYRQKEYTFEYNFTPYRHECLFTYIDGFGELMIITVMLNY